jgi:hypothetical protein
MSLIEIRRNLHNKEPAIISDKFKTYLLNFSNEKTLHFIIDNELKFYDNELRDGIIVYNGVLKAHKKKILQNIRIFKDISILTTYTFDMLNSYPHTYESIFTPLIPSTLSAKGYVTNVNFNEALHFNEFKKVDKSNAEILKIGCNFGEIYHYPNPYSMFNIDTLVNALTKYTINNINIGCPCNSLITSDDIAFANKKTDTITPLWIILNKIETNKCSKKRIEGIFTSIKNKLHNEPAYNEKKNNKDT